MLMIFLSAFVVGLSGAMMPGPLLTYTIQKALARGWRAGFVIIAGHVVLELCLIVVIFLGFDLVLQSKAAQIAIGLVGGILLVYMGIDMIVGSLRNRISIHAVPEGEGEGPGNADAKILRTGVITNDSPGTGGMILSGIVISATNPYFLMWWAIVGLGFIMQSYEASGFAGVAVYYAGHASVDVLWYGLISILIGTTRKFIREKPYRIVIVLLGCALVFFGLRFAYGAVTSMIQLL